MSLAAEAVAWLKSSLIKRYSLAEISPIRWKSLPSTGVLEDQPCSAVGGCDQTPRAPTDPAETGRIYRANPSEHGVSGSARITDLNLK